MFGGINMPYNANAGPHSAATEFLITFRPEALPNFAPEVMASARQIGTSSANLDSLKRQVDSAAAQFGLNIEISSESPISEIGPLTRLEREGLITNATPLRRPRQAEFLVNEDMPIGVGKTASAIFEAFPGTTGRPSDQILVGAIIVAAANEDAGRELQRQLLDQYGSSVTFERVPLRWTDPVVPVEASSEPVRPWHLDRIGLHKARQSTSFDDAAAIRLAVLDSGIDTDHPLLMSKTDLNAYQVDDVGVASGALDRMGHGTHVAGTIGSLPLQSGDIEGVCNARLHIYKVFDDDLDGVNAFTDQHGEHYVCDIHNVNQLMYIRALAACLDNNYDVVNLSLGGTNPVHSKEKRLFGAMIAQHQIVVAAMGNARRSGSPKFLPAAYQGVIAVGALDRSDNVATFSSKGDHICISAPGVDIAATMPTYPGVKHWIGQHDENGSILRKKAVYWSNFRGVDSGTSMAAPQVAGAAALWVAKYGRDLNKFRTKLETSARKLDSMNGRKYTADHGYGCLDIEALLR
jgi:Subtilase family